MTGRSRLPGGEARKASQRNTRRAAPIQTRITPRWQAGDRLQWKGRTGAFSRYFGDGEHAFIVIAERVYQISELG